MKFKEFLFVLVVLALSSACFGQGPRHRFMRDIVYTFSPYLPSDYTEEAVSVAELNQDGKKDVIVICGRKEEPTIRVVVLYNHQARPRYDAMRHGHEWSLVWSFSVKHALFIATSSSPQNEIFVPGDINGDGRTEIVFSLTNQKSKKIETYIFVWDRLKKQGFSLLRKPLLHSRGGGVIIGTKRSQELVCYDPIKKGYKVARYAWDKRLQEYHFCKTSSQASKPSA